MNLTKCKICRKKVAENAISCPHCGASLPAITDEQMKEIDTASSYHSWKVIAGVLLFGPLAKLAYHIVMKEQAAAEYVLFNYWPISAIGMVLYILGEIWRNLTQRKMA